MHRGHDGYITFHRHTDSGERFEDLFAVPARELESLFPEFIAPHVGTDSYFSINGYYRPGWGPSRVEPRFRLPKRASSVLRWLNACFVDLDCYKLGISVGVAVGLIIDMQDRGIIPPASLIARSGRGVWAFWMLHDDGGGPVRAWPETVATYKRIERALWARFAGLEADPQAMDVARITRVPGSLNTKASAHVAYWFQTDQQGQGFMYDLGALAASLGVNPCTLTPGLRAIVNPVHAERGRKGRAALCTQRLDKLLRLISTRGLIHEGARNHTALLLAAFMDHVKMPAGEVQDLVHRFGRHHCSPPLTRAACDAAFAGRKTIRKIRDTTIAMWLKITPEESTDIGWPAEADVPALLLEQQNKPASTREQKPARRALLASMVNSAKAFPPLATLKVKLDEVGLTASTMTIKRDLDGLAKAGLIRANPRCRTCRAPGLLLDSAAA